MTVIGNPRSFHKKFKFVVEIDDVGHAGFQKASELSVEVANVQYFEGGSLIPNKSPGRLTFADIVTRSALQNAASVASLMLTTEALIAERPKDEKASAGGGHAGHGHGDF